MINDAGDYGVGVYFTEDLGDASYWFYIGSYSDGLRRGYGAWFRIIERRMYEGEWANDKPNGEGVVRWGYNDAGVLLGHWTFTGMLVDGLLNGTAVQEGYLDSRYHLYHFEFIHGQVVVRGESWVTPEGRTVFPVGESQNVPGGFSLWNAESVDRTFGVAPYDGSLIGRFDS
jgi:hypothetical protein